uniref:type I-E CRISPR-associated protein Cse1/CasA n=1 Tax=Stappia sp. TaxID=1870903 RepID=UPI003BAC1F67
MALPNLNMVRDPVFPVLTLSGARRWECLSGLLAEEGDYPVAFDWPRGDLNVASAELAIGLLTLLHKPAGEDDWRALWEGRGEGDLAAGIERLAPFFNLLGDEAGEGPRFCQDLDELAGTPNPVEALFIDTPGANGQKKNSDLLTHRNRFPALGLEAAAMALYALQQFAPSGGAGNRTSMRGGGPMTTLVVPNAGGGEPVPPLKRLLLLNLPLTFGGRDGALPADEMHRALPWLRPTITSKGKPPRTIAQADPAVHPVQAFFGMPRRIRLVAEGEGVCPLTGREGPLVTGFVQNPWGMNYSDWTHPLTPYRQTRSDPPYTVKPKAGRLGFRDWVGVTVGLQRKELAARPAEVVDRVGARLRALRRRGIGVSLLAAGWAMNNMEAERYLEAAEPLHISLDGDEEAVAALSRSARDLAEAAEDGLRLLRGALNEALFGGQAKSTDSGLFEEAGNSFYERAEDTFHDLLAHVAARGAEADDDALARQWLATVRGLCLSIFDEHATLRLVGGDMREAERITNAYGRLFSGLSERSKIAQALRIDARPRSADAATPMEGA